MTAGKAALNEEAQEILEKNTAGRLRPKNIIQNQYGTVER